MDWPWIEQYDPNVRGQLSYPAITLPQLFDETAARHSNLVATIFFDARLRYAQLKSQIDRFAAGLQAMGIQPGDRVAVMLPNMPQFVVAFFGALRAGAIVVPTNPLYTAHELEHQLADAGAHAIVVLDRLFPPLQQALENTPIRSVIVTGIGAALPHRVQPLFALKQWREGVRGVRRGGIVHRFEDLLAASPLARPEPASPDDVAILQYTGGTTGTAKGAMLTHANLIANALQAKEWQGAPDGEATILCATPFFHVYGLTIGMNLGIASGSRLLLVPRFIPADILRVSEKYKPHFFPGVPTMYHILSTVPGVSERQFGSLEVCISGSAPLPTDIRECFEAVSHARIVEGYGLTEASPVTHCNPVRRGGRPGTIGVPFPDTDARVVDPASGEPVPPGTIGELAVRGPQVMCGYWNRPDETAAVLRGGWLHTGDLAVEEEGGFFRIVDRKKDVIIASGFNVYPREIE
jgi:long-chain acyl-CoA synthetase